MHAYIHTYIHKNVRLISVKQCSIHVSRAEYKVEKKIQTDYTFISTSLFRGCPLVRRFPDEWATTKQACRDKRVVRLNLFLYLIHIYIHTYSTYIHTYRTYSTYIQYIQYIHTYIHSYIHTYSTYIQYIHTIHTYNTYIHTYIHTHIHTYIHTYIHTISTNKKLLEAGRCNFITDKQKCKISADISVCSQHLLES